MKNRQAEEIIEVKNETKVILTELETARLLGVIVSPNGGDGMLLLGGGQFVSPMYFVVPEARGSQFFEMMDLEVKEGLTATADSTTKTYVLLAGRRKAN